MMLFWHKKSADQPDTALSELVAPEKKTFWKRKWLWGIVILLLVFIIFSGENSKNSIEPSPQEESTEVSSGGPYNTKPLCSFPDSWSYISDNSLRTSASGNLSPWNIVADPTVLYDQNKYRMYYTGNRPPEGSNHYAIGLATSADGINWKKYGNGPIFEPKNEWELPTCTNPNDKSSCSNGGVLEPSVLYDSREKLYKMWYAAVGTKDGVTTFRIGYATSPDGIAWRRMPATVLARGADSTWKIGRA